MEGSVAVTSVNDHRCAMSQGDLILTPAWAWHEHVHPGTGRVVWFDGLDLPLCTSLDTMLFEIGPAQSLPSAPPPTRALAVPAGSAALTPGAIYLRNPRDSPIRYA